MREELKKKVIISCAMCGAGTTKKQTPYVPITPEELGEDVVRVAKAGASVVHIHARDENGDNTMEPERFIYVIETVRKYIKEAGVDVCINCTSSGGNWPEDKRLGHLEPLLPELCSFTPGTLNWARARIFKNSPEFIDRLGEITRRCGIKPELEIFDAGMLHYLQSYIDDGTIEEPPYLQFVLGVPTGMPGTLEALSYLLPKMPKGALWSITGIGKYHMPMMLAGLAAGCNGLRVGVEDNIYLEKGVLATNEQLVKRAVDLVKVVGREVATAEETREMLGLKKQR